MGKKATVIIIDLNTSAKTDRVIECCRLLIHSRLLFYRKTDLLSLIYMNHNETYNQLNEESNENYNNIYIDRTLESASINFLESLDTIDFEEHTNNNSDIIDSLLVTMGLFHDQIGKKKFEKQVYIFSDLKGPILDDAEALKHIIDSAKNMDIKMNLITTDPTLANLDTFDNSQAEENMDIDNDNPFISVVNHLNGTIIDIDEAYEILNEFQKKKVNPTVKYRGNFNISDIIKIPVYTYGKTSNTTLPSLKKRKNIESVNSKIHFDRNYVLKTEKDEIIVNKDERIKAYRYGKTTVPVNDIAINTLDYKCEPCLTLIGFIKGSKIPRHQYMSTVDYVVAQPQYKSAQLALSALIRSCYVTKRVALVRYVKKNKDSPHICVLTPHISSDIECFYLNVLPFYEDVKKYHFQSFKEKFPVNDKQQSIIDDFVSQMDLNDNKLDNTKNLLKTPEETFNPILQRFYNSIYVRALDPNSLIPDIDPKIREQIYSNPLGNKHPLFDAMKEQFPLKENEIKSVHTKERWNEFIDKPSKINSELLALKKI